MKMKNTYQVKTLIDGYKLGKEFMGKKFVGVPEKAVIYSKTIIYGNKSMSIKKKEPSTIDTFEDKYGRGSYKLYYYEADFQPVTFGYLF